MSRLRYWFFYKEPAIDIPLRTADDAVELQSLIRRANNAKQRDRLRAVALAIAGESTLSIMRMLHRSRGFVQRWCYVYRDHGLSAVTPKSPPGRPTKLPQQKHEAFKQRVLAGPIDRDEVCTLRGNDFIRILEEEFAVRYKLSGVYDLLHRLNLSVLVPRPQHRKSDPEAMKTWTQRAPFLSATYNDNTPINASSSGFRTKQGSANKAR